MRMQSAPGSVGQVREAATQLLFAAKSQNVPIFVVGHITKDGALAGPKTLEHVVDTVLYFEGERHHSHRVVRAVKNRFGAVSELGVFEMTSEGLRPVPNPSQLFLAERPDNAPGSAVHCAIEGSRPLLVEVQALVSSSTFGNARRTANGIDQGRLSLLLAVLEKRAGLHLAGEDVFVNVAGGMTIEEPAADLSVVAAVASSLRNRVIAAVHRRLRRGRAGRRSARNYTGRPARARGGPVGLSAVRAATCEYRSDRPDPGRWRVRAGRRRVRCRRRLMRCSYNSVVIHTRFRHSGAFAWPGFSLPVCSSSLPSSIPPSC